MPGRRHQINKAPDVLGLDAWGLVKKGYTVEEAISAMLDGLSPQKLRTLAFAYLRILVESHQRNATLRAERLAERSRPPAPPPEPRELTPEEEAEVDRYFAEKEEIDARFRAEMTSIIDDYVSRLKVEWTTELLASVISLPDGTEVTWGAATIEQHRQRAGMFEAYAVANAEGAARHRYAIEVLTANGADCLDDYVKEI